MNVAWWRALASALAVILVGSGCTSVRRVLRLEPEAPLPAELPTAAFLGADRMLSAPGEAAGRFEHVVFPATGASGTLAPGDSLVLLDLTGSGVVRRIRLDRASADPHWLRAHRAAHALGRRGRALGSRSTRRLFRQRVRTARLRFAPDGSGKRRVLQLPAASLRPRRPRRTRERNRPTRRRGHLRRRCGGGARAGRSGRYVSRALEP